MSDIRCAVCSEPWDAYGVFHGDMLPWESKLFRAGAGCPSCAGHASAETREQATEAHARDVLIGAAWDEPGAFACDADPLLDAGRPRWARPENPVCWECSECRARVVRDLDVAAPKVARGEYGGAWVDGLMWENVRNGRADDDDHEGMLVDTLHTEGYAAPPEVCDHAGRPLCPSCGELCHGCGKMHSSDALYPLGGGYYNPHMWCEDCLGHAEHEAEQEDWTSYGARDARKALVAAFALSDATDAWLDTVSDDAVCQLRHDWHGFDRDERAHDQEGTTFDDTWADKPAFTRSALARWIVARRREERAK